jgi:hypothetical protein
MNGASDPRFDRCLGKSYLLPLHIFLNPENTGLVPHIAIQDMNLDNIVGEPTRPPTTTEREGSGNDARARSLSETPNVYSMSTNTCCLSSSPKKQAAYAKKIDDRRCGRGGQTTGLVHRRIHRQLISLLWLSSAKPGTIRPCSHRRWMTESRLPVAASLVSVGMPFFCLLLLGPGARSGPVEDSRWFACLPLRPHQRQRNSCMH